MVNVRSSMLSLMLCAIVAACATRAVGPPPAPPPSAKVFEAKVMVWKRDATPMALPAVARRVQLIVTPGWTKGEHLAWVISNGTDVVRVFHCTSIQRAELIDEVIRTIIPTSETPLDHISFSILGSIKPPPPPPPDPGGIPQLVSQLPKIYVQTVLQTAWNLNFESARIDGQSIGP